MQSYVITTGTVFGLLTLVHIWRMIEEGATVARDPWYILITLIAAALAVWAGRLVMRAQRR